MAKRIQEKSGIPAHARKRLVDEDFHLMTFITLAMKDKTEIAQLSYLLVVQLTEEIDALRTANNLEKETVEKLRKKIDRQASAHDSAMAEQRRIANYVLPTHQGE